MQSRSRSEINVIREMLGALTVCAGLLARYHALQPRTFWLACYRFNTMHGTIDEMGRILDLCLEDEFTILAQTTLRARLIERLRGRRLHGGILAVASVRCVLIDDDIKAIEIVVNRTDLMPAATYDQIIARIASAADVPREACRITLAPHNEAALEAAQ